MLIAAARASRLTARTQRGYIPSSQYTHKNRKNPFVSLPVHQGSNLLGSLKFELLQTHLPRTVQNFLRLLPRYESSVLYRVWPSMYFQAGDITKQDGSGGVSAYGSRVRDQSYEVPHQSYGVLSMVSNLNDVNSKFIVTFGPCHFFDYRYVAFGKMTEGLEVLRKIEKYGTEGGKPSAKLVIGKPVFIEAQPATALLDDSHGHKNEQVIYTPSRNY